jgi:hypothetical protein
MVLLLSFLPSEDQLIMSLFTRTNSTTAVIAVLALVATGCTTIRGVAALRHVDFSLDRVSDLRLAGVALDRIRSYQDLTVGEIAQLGVAVARKNMPLDFLLHVQAENPADNSVTAQLVRLDWMLLLQNRETISGSVDTSYALRPGVSQDVPIAMHLDLTDFFEGSAKDLVELALNLAGQGGEPKEITLRGTPTVDTPIGPIRYPQPITIASRRVGS